jgi:hypothetical protein
MAAFLWRQWAQLGLSTFVVEGRDGWVLDPEALILCTSEFGRCDPRLFDEMLDWILKNARFVNFPRLKSLHRRFFADVNPAIVAAVCDTVRSHNKRLNWRMPAESPLAKEPFFTGGAATKGFGVQDPAFLRYGFTRGPVKLRGLSERFNKVAPECLILRLRALFGTTARAEIMAYLITHRKAHPSMIASDVGFSQKNINDALLDMEASGVVHSGPLTGRVKSYFISPRNHAPFLHLPEVVPRWIHWPHLLSSLLQIHRNSALKSGSPIAVASRLIETTDAIRPKLEHAGLYDCFHDCAEARGVDYIAAFCGAVDALFADLNRPS